MDSKVDSEIKDSGNKSNAGSVRGLQDSVAQRRDALKRHLAEKPVSLYVRPL